MSAGTYAIRHALEVLGDSGFDEDIRQAALAELDDLEENYRIADAQRTGSNLEARRAVDALWAMVEQTRREGYLALSDRLYLLASDLSASTTDDGSRRLQVPAPPAVEAERHDG